MLYLLGHFYNRLCTGITELEPRYGMMPHAEDKHGETKIYPGPEGAVYLADRYARRSTRVHCDQSGSKPHLVVTDAESGEVLLGTTDADEAVRFIVPHVLAETAEDLDAVQAAVEQALTQYPLLYAVSPNIETDDDWYAHHTFHIGDAVTVIDDDQRIDGIIVYQAYEEADLEYHVQGPNDQRMLRVAEHLEMRPVQE
jgi:hypothetical protein